MNEKMVHRFRRTTAHTAPIRQREIPEHQIIQGKNPTMGCGPQEECHPLMLNVVYLNSFVRTLNNIYCL